MKLFFPSYSDNKQLSKKLFSWTECTCLKWLLTCVFQWGLAVLFCVFASYLDANIILWEQLNSRFHYSGWSKYNVLRITHCLYICSAKGCSLDTLLNLEKLGIWRWPLVKQLVR